MRDHLWGFIQQGEDMPQLSNRIDLDPKVRDARGFPAMRITYEPHKHELVASQYYAKKMAEVMKLAGAEWAFSHTSPNPDGTNLGSYDSPIATSRHIVGTVRMGTDRSTSVADEWGRLHDVPNVVIADSSLFPTGSGYGPTLTLVALSIRNMRALSGTL
jgi:choline dehydrogenase-like flavoprotein